jgi:hypothetical protein
MIRRIYLSINTKQRSNGMLPNPTPILDTCNGTTGAATSNGFIFIETADGKPCKLDSTLMKLTLL